MHDAHVTVRPEREEDYRRTEEAAREAFWNLYLPGACEHYLLHSMRTHPDFVAGLSFVLEINGNVEGGIFYTRSSIVTENGDVPTVTFGPVFVSPRHQRRGFGRKLITSSMKLAREKGFSAVLLLGYPHHYSAYGFRSGKHYGISMPDGKYYVGLLALPLQENALEKCRGYAKFSSVLYADEQDVQAFDAGFPYREKRILPCQKAYEQACAMLDE